MVSSYQSTIKVVCASCGAQYAVSESLAGRHGACTKCGAQITIPVKPPPKASLLDELDEPTAGKSYYRAPQYVGVDCRLCQTRLYGTPDQIGKELKCPDCGTLTALRASEPVKKKTPPALEGEQYELIDETARTVEPPAPLSQYVPVVCLRCETLLNATIHQVGQRITCPDCGAQNLVPPPPAKRPAQSVLTPDAEDYDLDEPRPPVEPPMFIPQRRQRMQFEEAEEAARADVSPAAVRRRSRLDARGRPKMPRQPLVTGVLPFLFSPGVPGWWVLFSLGYGVCIFMIVDAIRYAPLGGLVSFSALVSWAIGGICGIVLTAIAATCLLSIITESSDGHDEIQNWNTRYVAEWFPSLLYVTSAASAGTLPGALLARVLTDDVWLRVVISGSGSLIALPVVLLSQLYFDSPWGVFSGRIMASIARCPFSWLLIYVESALLFVICVGSARLVASFNVSPLVLMPLYVGAVIVYARLLGRLGWRIAEAMPVRE